MWSHVQILKNFEWKCIVECEIPIFYFGNRILEETYGFWYSSAFKDQGVSQADPGEMSSKLLLKVLSGLLWNGAHG